MEFLIGIAVIFILMFCLGVKPEIIITIAIGIVMLFIVFMGLIFAYACIIMAMSKKDKGFYKRFDKEEKSGIPYAYYMINGEEYRNMFPMEVIFKNKIYREEKEVRLFVYDKKKLCFDTNAVICCILGILVSIFLVAESLMLIFGNI